MRRLSAINVMSVGVFGAAVVAFVYLILIRPMAGSSAAEPTTEPPTSTHEVELTETPTEAPTPTPAATVIPSEAASIVTVESLEVWPTVGDMQDRTSDYEFGQRLSFMTTEAVKVALIAFPLYGDEEAPSCMDRNGAMPAEHPKRPFWSTGYPTQYEAGGPHFFEQAYPFVDQEGATHLFVWLVIRNSTDQVVWCNEAVYQLSEQAP